MPVLTTVQCFLKHYIKPRHVAYCIVVQSVLKRVRTAFKLVQSIMFKENKQVVLSLQTFV